MISVFGRRGQLESLEHTDADAARACLDRAKQRLSAASVLTEAKLWEGAPRRARMSVEAEAEWMPGRVGVDPPVGILAQLVSALEHGRAKLEHPFLVRFNVVHVEVEVDLLGVLLPRPARRPIAVHSLEGERRPFEPNHLHPVRLVGFHDHPTAEQFGIELGEPQRVCAVERYRLEPLDHLHHSPISASADSSRNEVHHREPPIQEV